MKKFLIAMLMAIVVLAGVFADADPRATAASDAQITITAQIVPLYPQFTLSTVSASVGAVDVVTATETTDRIAALNATAANTLAEGNDVTVNFAIHQASTAKVKSSYTITVTAQDLILKEFLDKNGNVVNGTPSADEKAINRFAVTDATPTVGNAHATVAKGAQGHEVNVGTFAASENVLTATYNGVVKVADLNDTALGTFSVVYEGDTECAAGNYESTVKIEIAAV